MKIRWKSNNFYLLLTEKVGKQYQILAMLPKQEQILYRGNVFEQQGQEGRNWCKYNKYNQIHNFIAVGVH